MSFTGSISVVNRKGETVPMHLETISKRLADLVEMEPPLTISSDYVASKTAAALINGIKTSEIDSISAGICASLIVDDYEYDELAARIIISSLHKTTYSDLRKYAKALKSYQYRNTEIKILHPKTIAFILENSKDLHDIIDYSKDYTYNYFGAVTLINSYLLSYKYDNDQKIVVERPQQMLMRVAIGIHLNEICDDGSCTNGTFQSISETYKLLSDKYYTHATPTLFNAGTINHTLSSCYLLSVNDSLENIYQRLTDISKISKFSGGVGIHVSQVRAQGSVIASTVGRSEGLVPMLRMYNESTKYVSQGGGKRKGSTAVYLEPWHADIESCILSQKQQGVPEKLCRDLFLALWVPDLFMERLKKSIKTGEPTMWSLMCPDECKGLADVYGDEFKHLYESYEKKGMYRKQMPIVQLWNLIVSTQIETGKPYLMYKDHVNRKCNQNNLGTIKSSNLCSEITIYSDDSQVGVCNLASICLPKFVIKHNDSPPTFDYNKLNKVTQTIVYNMNRVMDNNKYPIEQAKYSDDLHRPIGVGVQGLADVFMMMGEPFDSDKSRQVNSNIFETIYFAALTASNRLAVLDGSYSSFKTSMAAQGILQHNLWDNQSVSKELNWNWDELRYQIQYSGLRNSLLTCLMPTAGTSIIMENSESVEVPTSFLYTRSTLSGRFQVVNKYLMKDLKKLGLWNKSIRDQLIQHDGSVQSVIGIPQHIKNVYRTVFEYKMSSLIQCCADRERFICQSASNNRYVSEPSIGKLTKAHLLSWKLGIKTSSYYTRVAQVAKGKKFVSTVVDTQDEICTSCMA
jgi:ribonucleoside-diphosphate reductase alpha chain